MARLPGLSEFVILSAISKGTDVPVRDVIAFYTKVTGKETSNGAVYTSLERLVIKGIVDESFTSDKNMRGTRKIAIYTLTKLGKEEVSATNSVLRKIFE